MNVDALRARALEVGQALRADATDWARDRSWEVRAPVLLFLAYVLVQHLRELEYQNFFLAGIVLGTHEAGHALFMLTRNQFLTVAGGTILQWLAPLLAAVVMWRAQRDYFGVAFCLGWFGASAFSSATYVSDARGQLNLVLVSPWGGAGTSSEVGGGDWHHLLGDLGMLTADTRLAFLFQVIGVASFALALGLGGWLCWTMQRLRAEPPPPPPAWATRQAPGPRPPFSPPTGGPDR